jgi:hypothetical protein
MVHTGGRGHPMLYVSQNREGTYLVLKRVIIQIVCLQIEGRKYSIKFENNEPFQIERLNFTKCLE